MYAHIWAVHREYLPKPEAPQAYVPDEEFGLLDPWAELWDPHEQVVPEDAWMDGMFDCQHTDEYDHAGCDMDDPGVEMCPGEREHVGEIVTKGPENASHLAGQPADMWWKAESP